MAYKDPLDPRYREARLRHYYGNKAQYQERNREKKEKLRDIVRHEKDRPCMDCGVRYPYYVMDFDHRDPSKKLSNIAQLISWGSESRLREELAKCDLVCSNCHRERTHGCEAEEAGQIPNLTSTGFDS